MAVLELFRSFFLANISNRGRTAQRGR